MTSAGNLLMGLGVALLATGAIVRFVPGMLAWFGHLPGDFRIQGERSAVFIPITSMILISIVGSIVLNLVVRAFRGE